MRKWTQCAGSGKVALQTFLQCRSVGEVIGAGALAGYERIYVCMCIYIYIYRERERYRDVYTEREVIGAARRSLAREQGIVVTYVYNSK